MQGESMVSEVFLALLIPGSGSVMLLLIADIIPHPVNVRFADRGSIVFISPFESGL